MTEATLPAEQRVRRPSDQRKAAEKLDKNEILDMYRKMVLIRRFEEK
ncbi:MAG: pyruvate dehydrogenase (acetyl-transferring) E1 component subunit alpha, partial [Chloroflexota bacterium]